MSTFEKLRQQQQWRESKAKYREKVRLRGPSKPTLERRDPRSKLSVQEEGEVLISFLLGGSYEEVGCKHSISNRTVGKILSYWKGLCEERFRSLRSKEVLVEEPKEEGGGFF